MESHQQRKEVSESNGQESSRRTSSAGGGWSGHAMRMLAIATTLTSAAVMGSAKETKTIMLQLIPTLPPFGVPVTAKWSYSSAFVYFVVVNSIVCCYSAFSLAISIANGKRRNRLLSSLVAVGDAVMLALIFSANGAAAAIGMVGEKGIDKVGWKKVCDQFNGFCDHLMGSLGVSLITCLVYLWLVVSTVYKATSA